ncbi:uncharacterized protein LOC114541353 [Dendronephthya gigantea]|uniref:uncharacterized protein LOC114541353 n=1 Tax=Dendronephthya gigantea TaxID=151771 RepID=UPI00106B762A|nr:uncharacterized protein LOC114541353 [Dendronephthya gigantea]
MANNSVNLVEILLKKKIPVRNPRTFLVEGTLISLLQWSILFGRNEMTKLLKMSVKHHEKLQALKTRNCNQLETSAVPIRAFVADKVFKIGDGSCGSCVYVGLMADESEVAVKRMPVQRCERTAENEKEILSLLETEKSPFVVSYRGFYNDGNFMYLVIDLCKKAWKSLLILPVLNIFNNMGNE